MGRTTFIPCSCGCLKGGPSNRMSTVEAISHSVSETLHTQRPIHRFRVLKECEAPFKRELEMKDALRALVNTLESRAVTFTIAGRRIVWRSFLFRLPLAWAVHSANMAIYSRNHGRWEARKTSLKQVAVMCTPEWLSARLTARWKQRASASPNYQPA